MATQYDPVAIGIVGCGEVARAKHLRVLAEVAEARVVALADADPERLRLVADRYDVAYRYPDVEAMLSHPGLEAVGVCLPASAHASAAIPVIQAGKHLFVEKPLALTLEDADRMLRVAAASRQVCLMGFHMRWHRLIREARRRIQAGELGGVESIRTLWFSPRVDETLPSWRIRRESGGGALMEIAPHCYDLWRYLSGAEVEEVVAASHSGSRDDEAASVTARLSGGSLACAVLSERTSHEIEVEICGSLGRLRIGCQRFDGLEFFPVGSAPGRVGVRLQAVGRFLGEFPRGIAAMRRGGDYLSSYREAWRHFCQVVRGGGQPDCTIADGRQALRIALAAAASASEHRWVSP